MQDFIDKIPDVTPGTKINRKAMMAIQEFIGKTTVYTTGKITETNEDGDKLETTFGTNQIIQTFTGASGSVITKTTTFNADGTVTEVITQ